LRLVMEKRQLRNAKPMTTSFRGSKSSITLLSGEDQTRKITQQGRVRRQFSPSIGI